MQEFDPHIKFVDYKAVINLSGEDRERLKSDPVAMYLHSLRIHSKLPDDLHNSMLLHSFDPAGSFHVRSYLEWVHTCEERDERMASERRREAMVDRVILGSMVFAMLGYVSLLLFLVIK